MPTAAETAATDYFAWIADEHRRGLAGLPPGNVRSPQAGLYRLRSLVCHVHLHYVSFMHSRSLKYGIHAEAYGGQLDGMWKHYNDEAPMVPMPEFEAVKNACETGAFQHCAWAKQRVGLPATASCPCGFDLHAPLLPRVMLYEWQDPRPVLKEAMARLVTPPGADVATSAHAATGATGGGAAGSATSSSSSSSSTAAPWAYTLDQLRQECHTLSVLRHLVGVPLHTAMARDEAVEAPFVAAMEKMQEMEGKLLIAQTTKKGDIKEISRQAVEAIVAGKLAAALPPSAKPSILSCGLPDLAAAFKRGGAPFVEFLLACGYEFTLPPAQAAVAKALMPGVQLTYEAWLADRDEFAQLCLQAAGLTDKETGLAHALPGDITLPAERCDVWLLSSALRLIDDERRRLVPQLVQAECDALLERVRTKDVPKADAAAALGMLVLLIGNRFASDKPQKPVIFKPRNEKVAKALGPIAGSDALFQAVGYLQTDPADAITWYMPDGAMEVGLLQSVLAIVRSAQTRLATVDAL